MDNYELKQKLDIEIEVMAEQSKDLRLSDQYRLWTANKRTILAWSNNSYNDYMEGQFTMFDEWLSSFQTYGGISSSLLDSFNEYKEIRRSEK